MGKLMRIYRNSITGELSSYRKDKEYESTNLVFDSDTRAVYYKFSEVVPVYSKNFTEQQPMDTKVGFMCQYINDNGKYCRFIDNKIVEIG